MKTAVHLSRARGFTALELIIVLIIGFSIIGLSASKMSSMMTSSKTVKALDSILNLANAIKQLKTGNGYGNLSDDLIPTLIRTEVLPKSLKLSAGSLLNEWETAIAINVDATNQQKFVITYPGVPKAACNKLVKELLSNFTTVSAGAPGAAPTMFASTASLADIANGCDNNPTTDLVLVD